MGQLYVPKKTVEGFYGVEGGEEAMTDKEKGSFPAKNKDTKGDSFDVAGSPTATRERDTPFLLRGWGARTLQR